jgi:hypothetical protein
MNVLQILHADGWAEAYDLLICLLKSRARALMKKKKSKAVDTEEGKTRLSSRFLLRLHIKVRIINSRGGGVHRVSDLLIPARLLTAQVEFTSRARFFVWFLRRRDRRRGERSESDERTTTRCASHSTRRSKLASRAEEEDCAELRAFII